MSAPIPEDLQALYSLAAVTGENIPFTPKKVLAFIERIAKFEAQDRCPVCRYELYDAPCEYCFLKAQVKTLNEALSDSNDNARHKSKWGEYMSTDGEWEIRVQELDRTISALTEQNINLRAQVVELSKPVSDLEWNRCFAFTHDPINGSIPRSGVNSLIAARLVAAQKSTEPKDE